MEEEEKEEVVEEEEEEEKEVVEEEVEEEEEEEEKEVVEEEKDEVGEGGRRIRRRNITKSSTAILFANLLVHLGMDWTRINVERKSNQGEYPQREERMETMDQWSLVERTRRMLTKEI